jgi:hypothetical protein
MVDPIVCPESAIESANIRNSVGKPNQKRSNPKSNKLVCESTIESSNRRNFIKRAALTTAAVGVGGSLLSKAAIPNSSARSTSCPCGCNLIAQLSVVVDKLEYCDGVLNDAGGKVYFGNGSVNCSTAIGSA